MKTNIELKKLLVKTLTTPPETPFIQLPNGNAGIMFDSIEFRPATKKHKNILGLESDKVIPNKFKTVFYKDGKKLKEREVGYSIFFDLGDVITLNGITGFYECEIKCEY